MKILQRLTFISAMIIAIAYFLFTLSFSTGWAIGQTLGAFYDKAQEANKIMFQWGLYLVVVTAMNLLFRSTVNRRFFVSNVVFAAATAILMVICAVVTLSYMPGLKAMYLELNEGYLQIITAINLSEISTTIFDLGTMLSVLLIIQAILIITVSAIKITKQIMRAKLKAQHAGRVDS